MEHDIASSTCNDIQSTDWLKSFLNDSYSHFARLLATNKDKIGHIVTHLLLRPISTLLSISLLQSRRLHGKESFITFSFKLSPLIFLSLYCYSFFYLSIVIFYFSL